jgi:DNA-binding MarR family transcriptional regulator
VEEGFLIGAMLNIAAYALAERIHVGYGAAGFGDLRPSHDPVFIFLRPEGDRVADLARRAHMSKQAMGYLVSELEERGYVERVPDPKDRRAQLVLRTQRGWEVNRVAGRLVRQAQEEWAAQLGPERMQQLIAILRDLTDILGVSFAGSATEVALRDESRRR